MTSALYLEKSKYKSILCLDGKLPSKTTLKYLNLPIIAADGAANKLVEMGLMPDLIIGDCDSVSKELLVKVPHEIIRDQNASDFQKALKYAEKSNLLPAIICGISGGFLDHIINNIGIFSAHPENVFFDDEIIGFNLVNFHQFNFPLNTKLSIFGMPKCIISTEGLKWELKNFELSFPNTGSFFNRTISEKLNIKVSNGKALLMVYRNEVLDAGGCI